MDIKFRVYGGCGSPGIPIAEALKCISQDYEEFLELFKEGSHPIIDLTFWMNREEVTMLYKDGYFKGHPEYKLRHFSNGGTLILEPKQKCLSLYSG